MAVGDTVLFGLLSGRTQWLAQREAVLARNVANADTPQFRPLDLKAAGFDDLVRRGAGREGAVAAAQTNPLHLAPAAQAAIDTQARKVDGFETAPDGNAVVLPEQLQKMSDTELDYGLTTSLYRRYVAMLRTAMGNGQG